MVHESYYIGDHPHKSVLLKGTQYLLQLLILILVSAILVLVTYDFVTTRSSTSPTSPTPTSLTPTSPIPTSVHCEQNCKISLVESIPYNLTYPPGSPSFPSTFEIWKSLISLANHSIDIAAFYWHLKSYNNQTADPSDWQGEEIFNLLKAKGAEIPIKIAQNVPSSYFPQNDTKVLADAKLATVRSLNFSTWFGSGVLHTKLWVVDRKHFYIGSANLDWRSLTQVKEMGVFVTNCPCLGHDVSNIFSIYWAMGALNAQVPNSWPANYTATYNASYPLNVSFGNALAAVYLSSSPPAFCPENRQDDLSAILNTISTAKKFIHIAVMDYFPVTLYMKRNSYWPNIDDALRQAVYTRGLHVRLLASKWKHTRYQMYFFLRSLAVLNKTLKYRKPKGSIEVRLFKVPEYEYDIPFARVNHNKYMVTETTAYIGTSNWSGDYFISTAGVGFVAKRPRNVAGPVLADQLESVFNRNWFSNYSEPLYFSPI